MALSCVCIGIGEKISTLVQLYIDTGTIPDAEKLLSDEKFRTLSLFVKVFGMRLYMCYTHMAYQMFYRRWY